MSAQRANRAYAAELRRIEAGGAIDVEALLGCDNSHGGTGVKARYPVSMTNPTEHTPSGTPATAPGLPRFDHASATAALAAAGYDWSSPVEDIYDVLAATWDEDAAAHAAGRWLL